MFGTSAADRKRFIVFVLAMGNTSPQEETAVDIVWEIYVRYFAGIKSFPYLVK